MNQFNRTVLGAAVGGGTALCVHGLSFLSDITAPVSYPVRGFVGGAMVGAGLAAEISGEDLKPCPETVIGAGVGAVVGTVFNTLQVPFAPVICVVNLVSIPFTVAVGVIGGGCIGFTHKS